MGWLTFDLPVPVAPTTATRDRIAAKRPGERMEGIWLSMSYEEKSI